MSNTPGPCNALNQNLQLDVIEFEAQIILLCLFLSFKSFRSVILFDE